MERRMTIMAVWATVALCCLISCHQYYEHGSHENAQSGSHTVLDQLNLAVITDRYVPQRVHRPVGCQQ
jgi:hypothetical protein